MSAAATGGPAFPVPNLQDDADFNGMTLRDHFATSAMHALMVDPGLTSIYELMETTEEDAEFKFETALNAYRWADAMLKARSA